MAIQQVLSCDLTGAWHTDDNPVQTVPFAFEGQEYEIDLVAPEALKLLDVLTEHAQAGRKVAKLARRASVRTSAARPASDRAQNQAIREWARSHGCDVNERGRIPGFVAEAYRANRPELLKRDFAGAGV